MALPLTCNRILLSICQSSEAILIPMKLRDFGYTNSDALSVYGILTGMVFSTILFPCVLSNSLSVMLLPAISEANSRNRTDLIKKAVRNTTQLCVILGLLCTLGFLLGGKLDRHSFVSQCFSWFLCPNLKLDLSVSVSRKYAMQYSPRTWETNTYDADQFIRCCTAHWFHFYRYSKDWSVCLSVGHACQSDSDLRSGMDQSAQDARTPEAVCIASFIHSYRTYVKSVQNTLCSKHFT